MTLSFSLTDGDNSLSTMSDDQMFIMTNINVCETLSFSLTDRILSDNSLSTTSDDPDVYNDKYQRLHLTTEIS